MEFPLCLYRSQRALFSIETLENYLNNMGVWKMKTLKQQIQNSIDANIPKYTKEFRHNLTNIVTATIDEYLTQKRQELPNKKPYNHFGVIIDQYIEKELLEDLK